MDVVMRAVDGLDLENQKMALVAKIEQHFPFRRILPQRLAKHNITLPTCVALH